MFMSDANSGQIIELRVDPTKDLFISMLVKDLSLEDAIHDLIDNSVDGAKRLTPD